MFDVKKKSKLLKNRSRPKMNKNYGTVTYFYWICENRKLQVYCQIQSRNSMAWVKNFKHHQKDFPRKVAKALLDCDNIKRATVVNYLGNNSDYENFSTKKLDQIKRQLYEKLAVLKGVTALMYPEVESTFHYGQVRHILARAIPWTTQVRQVKIPIIENLSDQEKSVAKIAIFIHLSIKNMEESETTMARYRNWVNLDCLKPLNIKETKLFQDRLREELSKCILSEEYQPQLFKKTSRLRADPVSSFIESSNVEIKFGNSQFHWKPDNVSVKSGDNLTVNDLIESIRSYGRSNIASYFLEWSGPGAIFSNKLPVVNYIDASVPPNFCENQDSIIKIGKTWYRVQPEAGTLFSVNQQFISILKVGKFQEQISSEKLTVFFLVSALRV